MIAVFALIMGVLFGAGLYVAGMTNPAKVQGFLDISGAWDPSLIFVMAAGIPVARASARRAVSGHGGQARQLGADGAGRRR